MARYRFGDVELDTASYTLTRGDEPVAVEPQVFEVLTYLVEHRDRLVPRTELFDEIWNSRFVTDSALSSRIKAARAAIGDDGRAQRCIRTVHGRGFQFVADVETLAMADVAAAPTAEEHPGDDALRQSIRFVRARGDVQLAIGTVGSGPTLVKAANWLTHLEYDWHSPVWRHWWSELGRRFHLVRYDARGCGLSDHDLGGCSLSDPDVWVGDLEAIVDEMDLERFVLLGMSQGGGPAMTYALRHPERVSRLVLYGSYARGPRRRGGTQADEWDAMLQLMRAGWGGTNAAFRSVFTMTFMPEATSEQIRWFNELQQHSTDAEHAVLLESAFYDQDFSDVAARLDVPTLVLHSRHDRAVPYDEGRRLAGLIAGAEFVTLDSSNHVLTVDEPAWPEFLAHLDRFIASAA